VEGMVDAASRTNSMSVEAEPTGQRDTSLIEFD
jgi:hypothetical protein